MLHEGERQGQERGSGPLRWAEPPTLRWLHTSPSELWQLNPGETLEMRQPGQNCPGWLACWAFSAGTQARLPYDQRQIDFLGCVGRCHHLPAGKCAGTGIEPRIAAVRSGDDVRTNGERRRHAGRLPTAQRLRATPRDSCGAVLERDRACRRAACARDVCGERDRLSERRRILRGGDRRRRVCF